MPKSVPIRPPRRPCALAVEPLEPRRLFSAELVADVDPRTQDLNATPADLDGHYAVAWSDQGLYRTDGTAAGTTLIHAPFDVGFDPQTPPYPQLTHSGRQAFFVSRTTQTEPWSVWRTDGTPAGTLPVAQVTEHISGLTDVGGMLYFVTRNELNTVSRVWRSDGTAAGTFAIATLSTGSTIAFVAYGGATYFTASAPEGYGLWRTEGTAAGTTFVKTIGSNGASAAQGLSVANGLMYFSAATSFGTGAVTWRSDGTAAGTFVIRSAAASGNFVAVGAQTLFVSGGNSLYRTDGTANGTVKVTVGGNGNIVSTIADLKAGAGASKAFFIAHDNAGQQIWVTDGTAAGTSRVTNFPFISNSAPTALLGNRLLFSARATSGGPMGVWITDGTPGGTTLLESSADYFYSGANFPTNVGARIFYQSRESPYGSELHVTDGSPGGTHLVVDLNTTPLDGNPGGRYGNALRGETDTATVGGFTYFATSGPTPNVGGYGAGLWKTDGTPGGTTVVRQNLQTGGSGDEAIHSLTAWNGAVYFWVTGPGNSRLFRSDGTDAGTVALKTIEVDTPTTGKTFVPFGGALYFFAQNHQLWKTDGTPAGTVAVTDTILYGNQLIAAGNRLYFIASVPGEGMVWSSDGTAGGTKPAIAFDLVRSIELLTAFGDGIAFSGKDPQSGSAFRTMWVSDGTAAGTRRLGVDLEPIATDSQHRPQVISWQGSLYFVAYAGPSVGAAIIRSDGTAAGTTVLKDISPAAGPVFYDPDAPRWFTPGGDGRLYFAARTVEAGTELWVTDGTTSGTHLVRDVKPGPADGILNVADEWPIFTTPNGVVFAADDGVSGQELWRSAGTAQSTTLVADVNPSAAASGPRPMVVTGAGGTPAILFSARDPVHGRELWRGTLIDAPPAVISSRFDVAATGGPRVVFTLSEPVDPATLQATDFVVRNLTTGATIPAANLSATLDAGANVITLRFPGYPNGLPPDGNYQVTLARGVVAGRTSLPLSDAAEASFFVLRGDANGDRTVGAGDFNLLASHFGQGEQTWFTGDFDGDGVVGAGDFNLLASRFGTTLAAPAANVTSGKQIAFARPSASLLSGVGPKFVARKSRSMTR